MRVSSLKYFILLGYMFLVVFLIFLIAGCKKLVEVDPPITKVASEVVFTTNETSIAVVTGIYAQMANSFPTDRGILTMSLLLGLSADEFSLLQPQGTEPIQAYYTNQLMVNPALSPKDFWEAIYSPYIAQVNAAIEGLNNAVTFEDNSEKSSLNASVKKQLLGEAYFLRAFFYFYLVQLYGDVPLLLTTDYAVNSTTGRTPKELVYQQIVRDLQIAETNLNVSYVNSDVVTSQSVSPRIRPIKAAASALLSRVYLYRENYVLAEQYALSVINNHLFSIVSLDSVCKANNKEAIWQLQPIIAGRNTQEGWVFILPDTGPTDASSGSYPVFLNPLLVNAFDSGDKRRLNWVKSVTVSGTTYYYPYKYQSAQLNDPITEYSTIFRLAEQYLICAEARAKMGNLTGGDSMLNVIRKRAGLVDVHSNTQDQLFGAVIHERQVELFTEWGHRWLDLKRTGLVDKVMEKVTPLKGGNAWQSYQQWYPIPASEFLYNTTLLGHQNIGY